MKKIIKLLLENLKNKLILTFSYRKKYDYFEKFKSLIIEIYIKENQKKFQIILF